MNTWRLTRWVYLRLLGFVWSVAFLVAFNQALPLFGSDGLTPIAPVFAQIAEERGGPWAGFWKAPSIFWFHCSDGFLRGMAAVGLAGALALMLGVESAWLVAGLWLVYLSFIHAGGEWYGYGWEMLLVESGFLAIFLCPWRGVRLRGELPGLWVLAGLYRWVAFRLMLGAGLIKIRGDECWRDLTCLQYHYETQPNPSPLSWLLHKAPPWFQAGGVLWNHLVELILPFCAFGPRPLRRLAGAGFILFQSILICSGNLSFLNWLSLAVALWCLDDDALRRLIPRRWRPAPKEEAPEPLRPSPRLIPVALLTAVVAVLSINPVLNLLSEDQAMNTSYDPWYLVNSYGAFGSVSKERDEVVIQGTNAEDPTESDWRDYELPCKPGDVLRRPCLITPYHYRLDWQMWFVPLRLDLREHAWLANLVYKLLLGDRMARSLIASDPFPEAPPRRIRVQLYRYQFTDWGEPGWWKRESLGTFLRPVSKDDPTLLRFLASQGWGPLAGQGE